MQTLEGHTSWVRAIAFSPDGGTLFSGSQDQTVRLWPLSFLTASVRENRREHSQPQINQPQINQPQINSTILTQHDH